MKKLVAISILLVLVVACATTYDMPLTYKKNYVPGTNEKLRFDGYYMQPTKVNWVKPIYLYRDGSALIHETGWDTTFVFNANSIPVSWGNYKVEGDTIVLERFKLDDNANNYRRITMKGIILDRSIKWVLREENRQNPDVLNYETKFRMTTMKPDSSGNWTRTRAQYNK